MDDQNSVPAQKAAAVTVSAPEPTINKPAIPEDIMDDMAHAYVAENVRQFIANEQPEAIARAIIASGMTRSSDIEEVMGENDANTWFEREGGWDDLGKYFDEDSIAELGEKIDDLLIDARTAAVDERLIEMLLILVRNHGIGDDPDLAAAAGQEAAGAAA